MPFPKQTPRAFTQAGVLSLDVGQQGCYGLYESNTWVYVGKGDLRERLLTHLKGENPCIVLRRPTHYVIVVTSDMDNEEKRLIRELSPACNQKIG